MSGKVFPVKDNFVKEIFGTDKAVIGMIHLKALPGAPHYKGESLESVFEFALNDVRAYEEGEVDGLIIENAWDLPFAKPEDIGYETVAALSTIAEKLKRETNLPIGINCLANAAIPALAVARANDLPFVRVNQWVNAYVANEGFMEGQSAKALRYRSAIKGDDIKIFADVHVKHGSHSIVADRSLADQTHDAVFFDADVLIATGTRTGNETEVDEVEGIKSNTELPVIVGSGMHTGNVNKILSISNGCIVGSSLKKEGLWWNPVDPERVKEFMEKVKQLRKEEVLVEHE
ncbi:BtpA/SgcQ family protein [Aquibacillus koreensis]|uniref:BtpA/SgcQ family protein n=1 Tax=Aquibacillus koreensis TaxID=279446 RepID=A0A9X4AH62_9BACI|nr:BtpA/SgcQ family protein [Aquibacillus koreensis]MCT2534739.1 BtpA/SgcQ family protein [Aquibacillus koreensis]MDC3419651.1 BtpA/SgcQ family protein [Aquibacillus koreensis]